MTQPDKLYSIEELAGLLCNPLIGSHLIEPIISQCIDIMRENERLRELLHKFVTDDAIANYDSKYCWGCNTLKTEKCPDYCFLETVRMALHPYKPTELPGYHITEIAECRDCHTNKWYKANDTDMAYCIQCRENRTKTTE